MIYFISSFTKSLTFGLLIICCIENNFKVKVLSYIGEMSYGVYMYHPLLMYISFSLFDGLETTNLVLFNILVYCFTLSGTFLLSYLSYNYFELYFLKMKARFTTIKSGNNS